MMRRKVPIILTLFILLLGSCIAGISHLWVIDSFEKLRSHQTMETKAFIQKNLDRFLQGKNKKLDFDFVKEFFDRNMAKGLLVFQNINEVIYPKDAKLAKNMDELINMYIRGDNKQPFIMIKQDGQFYCFFKAATSSGQAYYFLFHKIILPKNTETFFISFYALVILLTVFSFFISKRMIGQAPVSNAISGTAAASGPGITTEEKPLKKEESALPKLTDIEISMFPKSKNQNAESLVVFQQPDTNVLNVLLAETWINDAGAIAWKGRMKDNFMDLSQTGFSPEEIVVKLLKSTRTGDNELRPGIFYGNFNANTQKMLLFKAGSFSLYSQDSSKSVEHLQTGSMHIPEKFTQFEERDFPKGNYFILFSSVLLKAFSLNNLTLGESVFNSINKDTNSAKAYLISLMKSMYSESMTMKEDTMPSGNLIVLYHKQD